MARIVRMGRRLEVLACRLQGLHNLDPDNIGVHVEYPGTVDFFCDHCQGFIFRAPIRAIAFAYPGAAHTARNLRREMYAELVVYDTQTA